ncbi:unnamed protein product [Neospora caninum Liverpool]|uniref:Kinesin, putative n=1 Tax=Neospora caninum (strain Liverpool) TaxID=572307 RepID=F0VAY7_NEOCL|nr:uncharacterized protein NCLIV_044255 [Neospora caninum Liverpool]CBZ51363.1 unnamed protein product [Neospora caninum Liverpool]CEL68682.1 TPA: kinesin, putative [Neospora caninum Liverpool]|eukprot:XP_003881396.1 uncharacterized protein NCLIV_044255 [Neospora caninum Liverpool]
MSASAPFRLSTSCPFPSRPSPSASPCSLAQGPSSPSSSSQPSALFPLPAGASCEFPQLASASVPLVPSLSLSPKKIAAPDSELDSVCSSEPVLLSLHCLPPSAESKTNETPCASAPSKNIQVVCRLRPIQNETGDLSILPNCEQAVGLSPACKANGAFSLQGNSIHVRSPPSVSSSGGVGSAIGGRGSQDFTFDYVFGEHSSQEAIFERIGKPLVHSVCSGFNATLLAYGQSSSGKTYTIIGDRDQEEVLHHGDKHNEGEKEERGEQKENAGVEAEEKQTHQFTSTRHREGLGDKNGCGRRGEADEKWADRRVREGDGLLPRMINGLFAWTKTNENPAVRRCIRTAAIEIYNETIRDLNSGRCGLKIQRQKPRKSAQGVVAIAGLEEKIVSEPSEAFGVLEKAIKARRAAATRMNAASSRSHFIFCITLQETVLDTGTMINKSLTCLGKVIYALAALAEKTHDTGPSQSASRPSTASSLPSSSLPSSQYQQPTVGSSTNGSSFVPYRDSKLTRVLQDALGGNSNTCLILTCSQDAVHLSESISTLRFGQRAMCVKNSPKMNLKKAYEEEEFRYEKRHQQLQSEYQAFVSNVMSWAHFTVLKFARTQVRLRRSSAQPPATSCSFSSALSPCRNEAMVPNRQGNRLPRSRDKTKSRVIAFCQEGRTHLDSTMFGKPEEQTESLWSDIVEVFSAMPKPSVSLPSGSFNQKEFLDNLRQNVNCILSGDGQEVRNDAEPRPRPQSKDSEEKEEDERETEDKCERGANDDPAKKTGCARSSHKETTSARVFSTDDGEGKTEEMTHEENEDVNYLSLWAEEDASTFSSRIRNVIQPGESRGSEARVRDGHGVILRNLEDEIEAYVRLRQDFHRRQTHARFLTLGDVISPSSALPSELQAVHSGCSEAQKVSSERTSHIESAMLTFKKKYLSNRTLQHEPCLCQQETKGNIQKKKTSDFLAANTGTRSERETEEMLNDQTLLPIETKDEVEDREQPPFPLSFIVEDEEKDEGIERQASRRSVAVKEPKKQERTTTGSVNDRASPTREPHEFQFPFVCHRRLKTECLRQAVRKDDEFRKKHTRKVEKKPLDGDVDIPCEKANETLWLWEKVLQLLEKDGAEQEEKTGLEAYIRCQDEHIRQLHSGVQMLLQHEETQRRK